MAPLVLFFGTLFGLLACGQSLDHRTKTFKKSKSKNTSTFKPMPTEIELWTLYFRSDRVYHIKRLISTDSNYFLFTYDVDASAPEVARQTFINKQTVSATELEKTKTENANFDWTPFKTTPVIFVQLQYSHFKDEMAALDKRQKIEQIIDGELKTQL